MVDRDRVLLPEKSPYQIKKRRLEMSTGKLFCQSIYNDLWRPTRVLAGEEFFRNEDVSWKISSKMFSRKRRRHPVKKTWVSKMRANCTSASYQASYLQYTIQLYMLRLHTGFIARDFLHQVSCSTHSLPMLLLTFTQKMEELYISEVWERVLHTYLIETLPALVVFLERNWAARRD